jgi:hypothetical protein
MSDEDYPFGLRSLEYDLSDEFPAWLTSGLIALSLAQLLMRLCYPRPGWQTLLRQPGFLGMCAASIGFCIDKGWVRFLRFESVQFPFVTALAVLIAWAELLGLRRSMAEPSWIDRLGRIVGIGWIVAGRCTAAIQSMSPMPATMRMARTSLNDNPRRGPGGCTVRCL